MTSRRALRLPSMAVRLGATAVLLLGPACASAQTSHRSGFWAESGIGSGMARNACARCTSATSSYGSASHLRAGWGLTQSVQVGAEFFVYRADRGVPLSDGRRSDVESVSITPIVLWYVGDKGFFLKGGVGLGRGNFVAGSASGRVTEASGLGSGLTLGVGFDVPLLSWLALTANLGSYVMAIGDVRLDSVVIDDVIATVYEVGLGLTLR